MAVVTSSSSPPDVYAQAYVTAGTGQRQLLLVNRRGIAVTVVPPIGCATAVFVDQTTGTGPAGTGSCAPSLTMQPFAVYVLSY